MPAPTVLEAVRFLLELCAVAALAVAGASVSWVLAVVAPLALVLAWGWWIAPKSSHRLAEPVRLATEVVLFVAVGVALAASGRVVAGVVLAGLSVAVAVRLRAVGSRA